MSITANQKGWMDNFIPGLFIHEIVVFELYN